MNERCEREVCPRLHEALDFDDYMDLPTEPCGKPAVAKLDDGRWVCSEHFDEWEHMSRNIGYYGFELQAGKFKVGNA